MKRIIITLLIVAAMLNAAESHCNEETRQKFGNISYGSDGTIYQPANIG